MKVTSASSLRGRDAVIGSRLPVPRCAGLGRAGAQQAGHAGRAAGGGDTPCGADQPGGQFHVAAPLRARPGAGRGRRGRGAVCRRAVPAEGSARLPQGHAHFGRQRLEHRGAGFRQRRDEVVPGGGAGHLRQDQPSRAGPLHRHAKPDFRAHPQPVGHHPLRRRLERRVGRRRGLPGRAGRACFGWRRLDPRAVVQLRHIWAQDFARPGQLRAGCGRRADRHEHAARDHALRA